MCKCLTILRKEARKKNKMKWKKFLTQKFNGKQFVTLKTRANRDKLVKLLKWQK